MLDCDFWLDFRPLKKLLILNDISGRKEENIDIDI